MDGILEPCLRNVLPVVQICAPGEAKAGVLVEDHRFVFGPRAMEEQECPADIGIVAQIEDHSRCQASFGPGPILLPQGNQLVAVRPMQQIATEFHAQAVVR